MTWLYNFEVSRISLGPEGPLQAAVPVATSRTSRGWRERVASRILALLFRVGGTFAQLPRYHTGCSVCDRLLGMTGSIGPLQEARRRAVSAISAAQLRSEGARDCKWGCTNNVGTFVQVR